MNTIVKQFNAMIDRGIMPLFEIELKNSEYLLVNLSIDKNGILFSFNSDNKRVAFDEEIIIFNDNNYCLPFDKYLDDLDQYLEVIYENITEGYILSNDLFPYDDE